MSGATNPPTALLRVWRGQPDQAGRYDTFEVPYQEGMSMLDGLRWIRARLDPTLAIRYSCINANVCQTCMALVNGEVKYTCTARLDSTPTTVGPLPKRPVIRDLVTDTVPGDERPAHREWMARRADRQATRALNVDPPRPAFARCNALVRD